MTNLRLDWCGYDAAKYAVEHWHYSQSMPVSKRVCIGVWEDNDFTGAVIFAWGANPNMAKAFDLNMTECAELVRVALTEHKAPVSRIISIAVKMLKRQSPGLRLIVSYADPYRNHAGGIYQAGNWIYTGETADKFDFIADGKILQRRAYTGVNYGRPKQKLPANAEKVKMPPKYRYLYPLDADMRKQIEPLRKPYPKRERGETDNAPQSNAETDGASPIRSLLKVTA
jgi:hypothetical protein